MKYIYIYVHLYKYIGTLTLSVWRRERARTHSCLQHRLLLQCRRSLHGQRLGMYLCIYACVCVCVCMCVCRHLYIYTYIHVYILARALAHTHTHTHIHTHTAQQHPCCCFTCFTSTNVQKLTQKLNTQGEVLGCMLQLIKIHLATSFTTSFTAYYELYFASSKLVVSMSCSIHLNTFPCLLLALLQALLLTTSLTLCTEGARLVCAAAQQQSGALSYQCMRP
jgi:hypothetical protein